MSQQKHRSRAAINRASFCETLERRMLLSLAPAGVEFRVNTFTTNAQQAPAVASDADGDFVVTWDSHQEGVGGGGIYAQRYNATGSAQGAEFHVNSTTTGGQQKPAVAMDADGDFVIVWSGYGPGDSDGGIFGRRYNAAGVPQGGEFRANTFITTFQADPAVASDAAGNFVVCWTSSQDGSGQGVYAQRYNAAGAPQGSEFPVNTFTAGNQSFSSAAMDASGNLVIAWSSANQDGSGDGIYAQRYNAAGVPQGGEFQVNTFTTGSQAGAAVAMDASGDFVIAWFSPQDAPGNFGVYAQRFNASGAPQGSEFRVNTTTASTQFLPSVAMDADGEFLVAWASYGQDGSDAGVYAQSFNASGVPQGIEFRVNTFTAGNQNTAAVAMDADGNAAAVWRSINQDGSSYGIYAQRYVEGRPPPIGSEFRVNTFTNINQAGSTVAADAEGDFVVTWSSYLQDGSNFGIYARRYNSEGVPLGTEFRVNTFTTGRQAQCSVATDADGDFVIAWQSLAQDGSGTGIYAQRYNAAGVAQGGEFRVNQFTGNDQRLPSVSMDGNGHFLVAWSGSGSGDIAGIFARRYDGAGNAQGNEFLVNTLTFGNQESAATAMDADGDFVIAWQTAADVSGSGVSAQRYNAAGVQQGTEFRVNTFTTGDQRAPSIAMNAIGGFVIAWENRDQDGSGFGVYAQRYDSAGATQGQEFHVNTFTTDNQQSASVAMDAAGSFVIIWESLGQDGSDLGVYAQSYNLAGVAQGAEFPVNTFTTNKQTFPSVGMDPAGDFTVTWTSYEQDGSSGGVYAQRYAAPAQPAPTVGASSFLFDTAPHRLRFGFNQNVSASLGTDDLVVENLTTMQTIPSTDFSPSYDAATNTGTFSYIGNAGGFSGVLPDGNYRATLLAAGITNVQGVPLPENHVFNFFFLNGDANHDGRVNLNDFNILAANFGQSPRNFTQGDFTYDTIVNLADFNVLAGRFGQVLGAATFADGPNRGTRGGRDDLRERLEELL